MVKSPAVIALLVLFILLLSSCAAQINGSLKGDGQADLNVYVALEPRMTALIRGLAVASGMAALAHTGGKKIADLCYFYRPLNGSRRCILERHRGNARRLGH